MTELRWGDLPERPPGEGRGRSSNSWQAEAAALRARPLAWAIIATRETDKSAKNMAQYVRNGKLKAFSDGKYESEARGSDVWARYLGA